MQFIENIISNAQKHYRHIVLPEGLEERTLKAADIILEKKIARLTLIGPPAEIEAKARSLNLNHLSEAQLVDPENNPRSSDYVDLMVALRKNKGLTREEAENLIRNPLYLATMMIKSGDADGKVAGAMNATGDVLRPAFQFVKTRPGISVVSGVIFIILQDTSFGDNGILAFADCAVHPNPNDRELAEIAVMTARTAKAIAGLDPRVAMLSFSTKGSAKHEMADKVIRATQLAREMDPNLKIDGELQADAAIIPAIGKSKAPGSAIAGNANVLIFPTLETGNIAYKLVQRMAHAEAVGPVLQGMAAPINDLSRGCSVDDIVHVVAITANQTADTF